MVISYHIRGDICNASWMLITFMNSRYKKYSFSYFLFTSLLLPPLCFNWLHISQHLLNLYKIMQLKKNLWFDWLLAVFFIKWGEILSVHPHAWVKPSNKLLLKSECGLAKPPVCFSTFQLYRTRLYAYNLVEQCTMCMCYYCQL